MYYFVGFGGSCDLCLCLSYKLKVNKHQLQACLGKWSMVLMHMYMKTHENCNPHLGLKKYFTMATSTKQPMINRINFRLFMFALLQVNGINGRCWTQRWPSKQNLHWKSQDVIKSSEMFTCLNDNGKASIYKRVYLIIIIIAIIHFTSDANNTFYNTLCKWGTWSIKKM